MAHKNIVHTIGAKNSMISGKEKEIVTKKKAPKKEQNFMTTDMITPEMREAGIDEKTPLYTREQMVEKFGLEKVEQWEKEAVESGTAKEVADTPKEKTAEKSVAEKKKK